MCDWWIVWNDNNLCFPCAFLPVVFDLLKKEGDCIGDTQSTSESIQDCTYLSNEKEVSLWRMLVTCPTKCNVFVGGLSPEMSSEILQAAFKTFVVEEEEKDKLKVTKIISILGSEVSITCMVMMYGVNACSIQLHIIIVVPLRLRILFTTASLPLLLLPFSLLE